MSLVRVSHAGDDVRLEEEDTMEARTPERAQQLAFTREHRREVEEADARTLGVVVLVNAVILAIGIVLGVAAPGDAERDAAAASGSLEQGARPLPGRRF